MYSSLVLLGFVLLLPNLSFSQCYAPLRSEGRNLERTGDYEQAINRYLSALSCPDKPRENDLADLIKRALQARVDQLEAARLEAERARTEAANALADLKRSNANVVRLLLQNAEQDILELDYDAALTKINASAALGVLKEEVAEWYFEIAFWQNEAGQPWLAKNLLDTAAVLTGKAAPLPGLMPTTKDTLTARQQLRTALEKFDAKAYQFFWGRYYPVMIHVSGGTFTMGCDSTVDTRCDWDEIWHSVTVNDFSLAVYETTWWQYYLFCQATGHPYESPGWGAEGNNPVVNVSWFDAVLYANWVSRQQGLEPTIALDKQKNADLNPNAGGYRLPTEAEWEFAAKGGLSGSAHIFSGGSTLDSVGWYRNISESRTMPVGGLRANTLGLFDMSGNVWEWCWDWYKRDYYRESPGQSPTGPATGEGRVIRGGDWNEIDYNCRNSNRNSAHADDRTLVNGFRLCRST